ncbi:hypothetical protein DFH11DRAFT_1501607 [Phellopilus nigrolimitatus]|nr:hypothetical protein DFH11DRAFT_1501607 [Phellopilus nigrolimitatus]
MRSRVRPAALRLNSIGVDPSLLIGKKLKHIRRSPTHPVITLSFADDTMYQILVDGYAPRHKSESVPRILEMDDLLQQLFDPPGGHIDVDLVIKDCAFIQLSDKAYERREWEQRWDQKHNAIAFKFDDEKRWHCVWAMLAEHDKLGSCTFRTFDDIYLQPLVRQTPLSPKKAKMPHMPQKNKSRKQDSWRKET